MSDKKKAAKGKGAGGKGKSDGAKGGGDKVKGKGKAGDKPKEKGDKPKTKEKEKEPKKEKAEKPEAEKTEKPAEKEKEKGKPAEKEKAKPAEKEKKEDKKEKKEKKEDKKEEKKDEKKKEADKPAAKKPAAKKKGEEKEKPLLVRPTNNVSIGIVGMPNVGKSTMFNLLSKQNVPAENYPFCTIDPSTARVPVPDERFDKLVEHWKPASRVPAVLTIVDIAGLVKGANEGKGLGNEFLSNIGQVDAIYHLTRAFSDKNIEHVEGDVDPVRDLDIISHELILKDLARVKTQVDSLDKIVKRGLDKSKKAALETCQRAQTYLEEGKDIRECPWDATDIPVLQELQLLTAKPIVYLVNISGKDFEKQGNKWFKPIKEWCAQRSPGAPVLPFSATFEQAWSDADDDGKKQFVEKKQNTQLPKIITEGYHALNLVHFFTCGEDEVRAWTVQRGSLAPQAAGVIHTDFQKCFIMAEQYSYDSFVEFGSEQDVRKAGKYQQQGKNYVVQNGDILFFKHSAGGGGGKGKKK